MKKRTWCYCMPPSAYEIHCDICGSQNITWSEYEGYVYCENCRIDTKGDGGIFSGPIPLEAMQLFGISFDRIDLKTGKRLKMKIKDDRCVWE